MLEATKKAILAVKEIYEESPLEALKVIMYSLYAITGESNAKIMDTNMELNLPAAKYGILKYTNSDTGEDEADLRYKELLEIIDLAEWGRGHLICPCCEGGAYVHDKDCRVRKALGKKHYNLYDDKGDPLNESGEDEGVTEFSSPYYELIMSVGTKYEGETRHETALRYIEESENRPSELGIEKKEG